MTVDVHIFFVASAPETGGGIAVIRATITLSMRRGVPRAILRQKFLLFEIVLFLVSEIINEKMKNEKMKKTPSPSGIFSAFGQP